MTETVPIFDWLRWVEVPIWLAMGSWLMCHVRHDHKVEVEITDKLGKLDGLEAAVGLILDKLIPDRKETE